MRLLGCTAIGLATFAGGLTFLIYGIAQAVENGSCGTDEYGNAVGPPCPEGFGPMIVLMVLGAFGALAGAAVFSARERGSGPFAVISGLLKFFGIALPAAAVAVVFGLVDLNEGDTRPGREIVVLVTALVLLVSLPGVMRRRPTAERLAAARARVAKRTPPPAPMPTGVTPSPTAATPPPDLAGLDGPGHPTPPPSAAAPERTGDPTARAEEIAARLRQLDQLRGTGLMSDDEYAERRRQILAEL